MKTQIITLAAHDDLISIRDRMSWAKAPRILLVWPPREQMTLQPLDLRILQKHARELGAELGLVVRGERIRRDAQAFGIPVFRSAVEAQRHPWVSHDQRIRRRTAPTRERLARLRQMQLGARPTTTTWTSSSPARMGAFVVAVLSVFAIAALFVPRVNIVLTPESQEQEMSLTADIHAARSSSLAQPGLTAQLARTQLNGTQTTPVLTRSEVATTMAIGAARFQNLSAAQVLVPAGTVVYSLSPRLVRFVTLQDVQLDTGANNIVDVPIEAMRPGKDANLPRDSLEGVEGSLSASVSVANPEPIAGGTNDLQNVPSETDRDQLRAVLEKSLQARAQAAIELTLQEGDMLLPGTLVVQSVERELFDPPAGQAASILSLTLDATYQAQYIRGTDLRGLALLALDAQVPADFVPKGGTLRIQVNEILTASDGQPVQLQLDLRRTLNRRIDLMRANQLVRGSPPSRVGALLEEALPLAAPPDIRLTPPWWPWLPLIPFRIDLVAK